MFRVAIVGALALLGTVGLLALDYYHSPYWNGVGVARDQPVLFSHRHHAGELRSDCRYCHVSVETAAFAGMPSTRTCLTCHSQLFPDTPMLKPLVTSAAEDRPLAWHRVNALPDHVYFDHSIHVAKGVGCTTCHGEVGDSPLMAKAQPLTMRWCLDCHRDPAPHLRPADEVFAPTWTPPANQTERGRELMRSLAVHPSHLTNCSTCHH